MPFTIFISLSKMIHKLKHLVKYADANLTNGQPSQNIFLTFNFSNTQIITEMAGGKGLTAREIQCEVL